MGLIQHSLEGSPPRDSSCPKPGRGEEDSRQPLAAHTAQRDDGDRNTTHNTTVSCLWPSSVFCPFFFSSNTRQPQYFLSIKPGGDLEGTKSTFVLSTAGTAARGGWTCSGVFVSCKLPAVCTSHTHGVLWSPGCVIPAPITCTAVGIPAPARGAIYWILQRHKGIGSLHLVSSSSTEPKYALGQLLLKHGIILIF